MTTTEPDDAKSAYVTVRVHTDDGRTIGYQIERAASCLWSIQRGEAEMEHDEYSLTGRARIYVDERDWSDGEKGYDLVAELLAEVERLRQDVDDWRASCIHAASDRDRAMGELEYLRRRPGGGLSTEKIR